MKKVLFLLFLTTISCKSFKDFTSQEVTLTENKTQKFNLENNRIIIPLTINAKKGDFLFDTGAMKSVLTDDKYVNLFSLNKENYYTAVKVKGATGDYIASNHFISDSINSEIITGKKNIFRHIVINNTNMNCFQNQIKQNGIIGFDILKTAAQPIILDFDTNEIKILNSTYSKEGFTELDAKIQLGIGNKITIPFMIDGIEIDFLFDTGNNGGFLMSNKYNKINVDKKTLECETLIGSVGKFSLEKINIYKNVSVQCKDIIDIKTNVSVFPKLTTNTVGIAFIKQFNWILDFRTGVVYVKKIAEFKNENSSSEIENTRLKSIALGNKLIIGFKNLSIPSSLNAGDEIISVNNQKVTTENICELQDLLNKTEDWNSLQIELIPANK